MYLFFLDLHCPSLIYITSALFASFVLRASKILFPQQAPFFLSFFLFFCLFSLSIVTSLTFIHPLSPLLIYVTSTLFPSFTLLAAKILCYLSEQYHFSLFNLSIVTPLISIAFNISFIYVTPALLCFILLFFHSP